MKKIGIGIIGFGFMGHEHIAMLQRLENYDVIGVYDIDPEQLKDVPDGVKIYSSVDELLADEIIDVALIVVNNNQHRLIVEKAARAGKDIICEKPVALTVDELDEMVKVVDECGVKFTVHQQRRYDPDFRTMKAVYDSGKLGKVYSMKSSLYGFNGNMHDWHVYLKEGGGMLYDWGVHLLDQVLFMMPEAKLKSVYADLRNVINFEVDDYFKVIMRFDNDTVAEVELGTYFLTDKVEQKWFERHWMMCGDKACAYVDGFDPDGKIVTTSKLLTNVGGKRTMTAAGPTRSFGPPADGTLVSETIEKATTKHEDFFENYYKAYNGEEDFLVKIPETRRVLKLMDAVRESARTGESVRFEW